MKSKCKRTTVTIGIPALNEGKNIRALVQSLFQQYAKEFVIEKIVVVSDGSTDNTVDIVRSFVDPRVMVIDGDERRGKAIRQNEIVTLAASDILVFLDADIKITKPDFISQLISPIVAGAADFTSGSITAVPPIGMVDGALAHIMKVKTYLYSNLNNGDNVYSCFGPARAFSKKAYEKLHFSKVVSEDAFSYLQLKQAGMRFASVSGAVFCVCCPRTLTDHQKQSVRFLNAHRDMARAFGADTVKRAYMLPLLAIIRAIIYSFITSPFNSIMYIGIFIYMKIKASFTTQSQFLWEAPTSSKDLS